MLSASYRASSSLRRAKSKSWLRAGLPVTRVDGDWVDIGDGPARLSFQHAPGHQPPRWPDPAFPQQVHLDIHVDDITAAEAKVLALGATRLPSTEPGFRVYADPAGHPFCLAWE